GPVWFDLGPAHVQPFMVAPWAEDHADPRFRRLPRILQRLRGEWVCVPFGIDRADSELPPEWRPRASDGIQSGSEPHGRSSNADWQLGALSEDRIEIVLEYPNPHPVRVLRRTICASQTRPELEMTLQIDVRAECELPIGLHPTLRLPHAARRARIDLGV